MIANDSRSYTFADAELFAVARSVDELVGGRMLHQVGVTIAATQVVVAFTNAAAARLFAFRYSDLLMPSHVVRRESLRLYVLDNRDGICLWARPERAWFVRTPQPAADVIAFFADNALMLDYIEEHRYISFHAAVLAHHNNAFAVLGVSTAGKSTTAVACAARGMTFFSDERCLLDAGQVTPFPRALTLRPNGRRRLLVDDGLDSEYLQARLRRADVVDDFVVPPSQLLPSVAQAPAPLRAMFLISGYADHPHVERADLFGMLPELMLSMSARERGLDRMARAMHELQNLRLFRLTLGSPSATAQTISDIMQHGD